MGSHGVLSECGRKVIPESPLSTRGVVELRPPRIVLTQIAPPPSQSATMFNFSTPVKRTAPIIRISKADPVADLERQIRVFLNLPSDCLIRCYKFAATKNDFLTIEMPTSSIIRLIPDREDTLDIPEKPSLADDSKTVGEIGIVEPYIGIAVEYKSEEDGSWPLDTEPTSSSGPASSSTSEMPPAGGRTLGSTPGVLTLRSRSQDRPSFDDDEDSGLGRLNGHVVSGPVLPGSYPRHLTNSTAFNRSASAERYGERSKTSFNSRFASQSSTRVRGTTGLNNLGIHLLFLFNE